MTKEVLNGATVSKVQNQKKSDQPLNGQSEESASFENKVGHVDFLLQVGIPLEVILGFGYLNIPDKKFSEFSSEQKEKMFKLVRSKHPVISEVLKSPDG